MKPTQEPTETDFIKAAIIIDCEGNITISGNPPRRSYALHVDVGNTAFVLLDWRLARFGGYMYPIFYKDKRGPPYAPAKRWRIVNRPAADLLTRCLPHFIIKREQAEIAIRFQAIYKYPGERATESDKLLRERFKRELLALTARGPKPNADDAAKRTTKKQDQGNLFAKEFSN